MFKDQLIRNPKNKKINYFPINDKYSLSIQAGANGTFSIPRNKILPPNKYKAYEVIIYENKKWTNVHTNFILSNFSWASYFCNCSDKYSLFDPCVGAYVPDTVIETIIEDLRKIK